MTTFGIIQCRMSSQRLPQKAILKLNDHSILEWVIKRSLLAKQLDKVIVATTTLSDDDAVESIANAMGVEVFRGSLDNVMQRYISIIEQDKSDDNPNIVVRITADNPLTSPEIIDQVVLHMKQHNLDYCFSSKIPIGCGVDAFKSSILLDLYHQKQLTGKYLEHINLYLLENYLNYHISSIVHPDSQCNRSDISVTIDTEEDYKKMVRIASHLDDLLTCSIAETIDAYDKVELIGKKYPI